MQVQGTSVRLTLHSLQVLTQNGKVITIVDISNTETSKAVETLREAQKEIATMTHKTYRLLTNASGSRLDQELFTAVVEFIKSTPYVTLHAIVCLGKIENSLAASVSAISGREIKSFGDRTEAIDWLSNHR